MRPWPIAGLGARQLLPVLALLANAQALATERGGNEVELDPITVTPRIAPLDEPYERLRRMMADPECAGCPPLISVDRETVYLKAGKVIGMFTGYGLTPPDPSHEERLDLHVAHDWRRAERMPEN